MNNKNQEAFLSFIRFVSTAILAVLLLPLSSLAVDKLAVDKPALDRLPSNQLASEELALPEFRDTEQIVYRTGYTLALDAKNHISPWVSYVLTKAEVNHRVADRADEEFKTDFAFDPPSASPEEYGGSGYQRGHLAPARDMEWSTYAMSDSFWMSNIAPMKMFYNIGIWAKLERLVRAFAKKYDEIYVTTGAVLEADLPKLPNTDISIPRMYYKVLMVLNGTKAKAIGFLIPQNHSDSSLRAYVRTVDQVEAATGIDFFARLPDELENEIESQASYEAW